MTIELVALLSLSFSQAPSPVTSTGTAEFIQVARGLEHLSDDLWAPDCAALEVEVAAKALTTDVLAQLLQHPEPRVRAAALVGLYVDGRTSALPGIHALVNDQGQAAPHRSRSAEYFDIPLK
jgi:hypothetical protein